MTHIDPALLAHATPQELALIEQALRSEIALSSPADYAEAVTSGEFERPKHIELISQRLTELVEGRLLKPDGSSYRKLMVFCPPRHGKSHLLSTYAPAWYLTRYPTKKVVVAGYESTFAEMWGRKVRDVLSDAPKGLAPELRKDVTANARWETTAGGGMFTAGVGGPLTGRGAHLAIVDDPVKNWQDAQSETLRESAFDWFRSTFLTRLEPGGVVVVIQTRWHADDLSGRLLSEEGDDWYVLSIPAIAGASDPLCRLPGEALWPERYNEEQLQSIKASVGPFIWAALYQQSPQIEGGGIFRADALRYSTYNRSDRGNFVRLLQPEGPPKVVPEAQLARFMVVDLAASTKTTADFSVYAHFGVTPDKDLVLLDAFRARIEGAEHMATLERLYNAWKPRFCGIERATYGLSLIQTAARTGRIPIRELKPDFDKVSRAYSAGALAEAGKLYLPKDAPWLADWVAELVGFPNAAHDDCVDVTAYAAHLVNQQLMPPRRPRDREPQTMEERLMSRFNKKRRRDAHPSLGSGF